MFPLLLVFKITYIPTVNSHLGITDCCIIFSQPMTDIVCMIPPLSMLYRQPQCCSSRCHGTGNINSKPKVPHCNSGSLRYIRKKDSFYKCLKKTNSTVFTEMFLSIVSKLKLLLNLKHKWLKSID
jgi:hypothetical protein